MIIDSPEEAERIVTQVVENIQRAELVEGTLRDLKRLQRNTTAARNARRPRRAQNRTQDPRRNAAPERGQPSHGAGAEGRRECPATPAHRFSKFLTIDQVAEILNVNKPTIYTLLRNGQLRLTPGEDDLHAYLDAAYHETAERGAADDVGDMQTEFSD